jgi:hypothetical protein
MKTLIVLSLSAFLFLSPLGYLADGAEKQPPIGQQNVQKNTQLPMGKNQEIQNIKPKKPVKIKLHRNTNGEYTWDISGDNADEIYRADSRLKKLLKIEK